MCNSSDRLKEFCETTTWHGFIDAYKANRTCLRTFWILTIIFSSCTITYFIFEVINGFMNAPLVTLSRQIYAPVLELPEVAICNSARLNATKMEQDGFEFQIIKTLMHCIRSNFSFARLPKTELIKKKILNERSSNLQSRYSYGSANPELRPKIEEKLKALNVSLESLVQMYAFNCEEIVTWCFDMPVEKCCENSRIVVHVEYSGCFVLPRKNQNWPGAGAGWVMLLRAPKLPEFYENSVAYDGFFIEFSRNYEMYTYDSSRIPLGFAVDVALEATKFQRLEEKMWPRAEDHPLCNSKIEQSNRCFENCFNEAIMKSPCKCLVMGNGQFYAQKTCYNELECYKDETVQQVRTCENNCRPACEEWVYQKSVTFNKLTIEGNQSDRLVQLRIAYPRLMYNFLEEQETQTLDLVVGNIGGQLGLWLGGSVLSIVQILVLISSVTLGKIELFK